VMLVTLYITAGQSLYLEKILWLIVGQGWVRVLKSWG
jgi:hypothetical protein